MGCGAKPQKLENFRELCVKVNLHSVRLLFTVVCKLQKKLGEQDVLVANDFFPHIWRQLPKKGEGMSGWRKAMRGLRTGEGVSVSPIEFSSKKCRVLCIFIVKNHFWPETGTGGIN